MLILFLVLFIFLPKLYGQYQNKSRAVSWQQLLSDTIKPRLEKQAPQAIAAPPSAFNPNTISKEALIEMGLASKAANILIKYREKGGQFRVKEDLLKIYSLDHQWYKKVEAFIEIPDTQTYKKASYKKNKDSYQIKAKEQKTRKIIAINTAKAEDWKSLYGIGPVLSGRIIKFRDKLGGFYSVDQVAQTYGLADSTFQKIRPQLKLSTPPQKISINTLSIEDLAQHPYIDWKMAKRLVRYREMHGSFADKAALAEVRELDPKRLTKVLPYFDFDTKNNGI